MKRSGIFGWRCSQLCDASQRGKALTSPTSHLGKLWLILFVLNCTLTDALFSGVAAGSTAVGWPTIEFKAVLKEIDEASFVAITYYDGSKVFVTDKEWIGRLKELLGKAAGMPAQYCFCINYPQVAFANNDRIITSMEVPHGQRLRFSSAQYTGDFTTDGKIAKQVSEMLTAQRKAAISHRKPLPGPLPPAKIQINLEGSETSQQNPAKDG